MNGEQLKAILQGVVKLVPQCKKCGRTMENRPFCYLNMSEEKGKISGLLIMCHECYLSLPDEMGKYNLREAKTYNPETGEITDGIKRE